MSSPLLEVPAIIQTRSRFVSAPASLPSRGAQQEPVNTPTSHHTPPMPPFNMNRYQPMETTATPEALRRMQLQAVNLSPPAASRTESTMPSEAAGSPEPLVVPLEAMRFLIKDLASRALKEGYRQPMNFHEDDGGDAGSDPWSHSVQLSRYTFTGVFAPADPEDPVQWVTNNEGILTTLCFQIPEASRYM
ncbi:hypothetical protein DRE_02943 [Drechslerella stenobrocha 248]|uniref:Uncharacterized protein n=1 Tax=Drechslerella stenobrocha 248 TaxID=1043628 RepID=W7I6D7_9PEZI|nr:hypothetical protein DRE_02943 [Drechslerella stenobrocha 248]